MIVSPLTQGLRYRAACDTVLAETINHVQSITQSNCRLACFWVHSKLLCAQNFPPGVALLKQLYRRTVRYRRQMCTSNWLYLIRQHFVASGVTNYSMMSIDSDTLISRFYAIRESPQNRSTIPPCSLGLYAAANNTALLA